MPSDNTNAPRAVADIPSRSTTVPTVTLDERRRFDTVIDARSPAEYALDHIPGAINCPVLDNDERHVVGTLYVQQGAFEARRVGGAIVAANLARHLREQFSAQPPSWRPLVYCWRGGLRSVAMTSWLRTVGWDACQLTGGYKTWRRHVIDAIDKLVPGLRLVVICGATGSAKTRVLQALGRIGHQTLDLESLARHKGSMLGQLPGIAQPSQKAFETGVVDVLERCDPGRPVFVEGESRKIGQIALPQALVDRMRASPCVEIDASLETRVVYLLRDYAYLGDDPERLAEQLAPFKPLHGKEQVDSWQAWARSRDLAPLFAALAAQHYDPHYARSQGKHFLCWDRRTSIPAPGLAEDDIEAIARRIGSLAS